MQPIPGKVLTRYNQNGNVHAMNMTQHILDLGGTAKLGCSVIASLASTSQCSAATLYMIALGHKQAGPLLARRIEAATEGKVTIHDLRPDIFGEAPLCRGRSSLDNP